MRNVAKLSVKLMLTVLTNRTPEVYMWTCAIWMTSFAASRKWSGNSEQVFINQLNFRPASIGKHNSMGHLLPCAIDLNKSPTHTFAVDCETWHCKWAAPCYFNGALPTGSLRWGYCLQWHLACEGLYGYIWSLPNHNKTQQNRNCVHIFWNVLCLATYMTNAIYCNFQAHKTNK